MVGEGTLGTTGFDYSGPRRSHEGARATGRHHVHGPLFIDLPELELRGVEDKPADSSSSPESTTRLLRGSRRYPSSAIFGSFAPANRVSLGDS